MPTENARLIVLIQMALGVTQRELGGLLGRTKRTIQRWQSRGTDALTGDEARMLADRLRPTHPDLADQVMALGARYEATAGKTASPEVLAAILGAAAQEGHMTSEAVRPLVAAAFEKAVQEGVSVQAVVVALRGSG